MAKPIKDAACIEYFNMGPWPVYVGCTDDKKAFKREMARICPGEKVAFLANSHSHASTNYFTKDGCLTIIVTIVPKGKRDMAQYVALIAHECMHIVQEMRDHLISNASTCKEGLGVEAEAYLIQYLVQQMMNVTCKTRLRKKNTPSTKKG